MPPIEDTAKPWDTSQSLESPPASVIKILDGALQAIAGRGVTRLTMSDICHVSGVSRGTLYRYFTTKDDVLYAVSEYVSLTFENGIRDVAAAHTDPVERLRAVMRYHNDYTGRQGMDRLLAVEPGFLLNFFSSHFDRHRAAILDALSASFDHFEDLRGKPLDRGGIAEMLIRLQLSRLVLPADTEWNAHWENGASIMERILSSPA